MRRAVARERPVACAACDKVIAGRSLSNEPSTASPLASVAMNSLSSAIALARILLARAPRRRLTAGWRSASISHSANLRSIIEHNHQTLKGARRGFASGVNAKQGTARIRGGVPIVQGGRLWRGHQIRFE